MRGLLCAVALAQAYGSLPVQNTVTTDTLNSEQYFDRIITIGAVISRDNSDKYATLGGMLWGSWELLTEWINIKKGGINIGNEKWGVKIIEIEDYSNTTMAGYGTDQLVGSTSQFDVDFMFGPYSSGLTMPVLNITETNAMLLLASGSNQPEVWDGSVQYGYGLLYPGGGYFVDSMALYKAQGALTVALICNSAAAANSCNSISQSDLTSQMTSIGMTLTHYYTVNSDLATYWHDLNTAVLALAAEDTDVLVLLDYYYVCVDALSLAVGIDWTPKGTYLSVCNNDADALTAMGNSAWYAGTYSAWASQSTYTSGISGLSVQQFTTEFFEEFDRTPTYQAAASFAAGEILVSAMETQAGINASLCLDSVTLAALIAAGSYSTILSQPDITFDSNHQSVGEWVTLQYNDNTALTQTVITSASPLTYPQPTWASRAAIDSDDNNDQTCISRSNLAVTATMCFLGGMAMSCIMLVFAFPKFLKSQQQGMPGYAEPQARAAAITTGAPSIVGLEMNPMASATETKNAMHTQENA